MSCDWPEELVEQEAKVVFTNKPLSFGMKIRWRWRLLAFDLKRQVLPPRKNSCCGTSARKFVLSWNTCVWLVTLVIEWLYCFCVLAILACLTEIARKITWGRLVSRIDPTWLVGWKECEFLYSPSKRSKILNPCWSVNEENHFWLRRRSEIN